MQGCLDQYERFVKPSFDKFIQPTMSVADVVCPRGADNKVAMGMLIEHLKRQLEERRFGIRKTLSEDQGAAAEETPVGLHVMPQTNQVRVGGDGGCADHSQH